MGDRARLVIALVVARLPFGQRTERSAAMARLERLEERIVAILTAAEADRAQRIIRESGRRRG